MSRSPEPAGKIATVFSLIIFIALIFPHPAPAQTAEQEDPFYKKLFEEGKYFYESKNFAGAIEDFEIAFFGYLDNEPRLLECYMYLTVCHFQQKNYEKAKYYIEEIKRLNLEDHLKAADPPEDLLKKYEEIAAKLHKTPQK